MSRIPAYVAGFAIAMVGYAAAVIVATLASIFLMLLLGWQNAMSTTLSDLFPVIAVGLVMTFMLAFPGFCITLFLAWKHGWRNWRPFTVAGGADALLALLLHGIYDGSFNMPVGLVIFCVPGGLAGGLVYWLVAGQFLAGQREAEVA